MTSLPFRSDASACLRRLSPMGGTALFIVWFRKYSRADMKYDCGIVTFKLPRSTLNPSTSACKVLVRCNCSHFEKQHSGGFVEYGLPAAPCAHTHTVFFGSTYSVMDLLRNRRVPSQSFFSTEEQQCVQHEPGLFSVLLEENLSMEHKDVVLTPVELSTRYGRLVCQNRQCYGQERGVRARTPCAHARAVAGSIFVDESDQLDPASVARPVDDWLQYDGRTPTVPEGHQPFSMMRHVDDSDVALFFERLDMLALGETSSSQRRPWLLADDWAAANRAGDMTVIEGNSKMHGTCRCALRDVMAYALIIVAPHRVVFIKMKRKVRYCLRAHCTPPSELAVRSFASSPTSASIVSTKTIGYG